MVKYIMTGDRVGIGKPKVRVRGKRVREGK